MKVDNLVNKSSFKINMYMENLSPNIYQHRQSHSPCINMFEKDGVNQLV